MLMTPISWIVSFVNTELNSSLPIVLIEKHHPGPPSPAALSPTLEDREASCVVTELPQVGCSLRTIRWKLSWNALFGLLSNLAEAYMRWVVAFTTAGAALGKTNFLN